MQKGCQCIIYYAFNKKLNKRKIAQLYKIQYNIEFGGIIHIIDIKTNKIFYKKLYLVLI